MKNEKQLEKLVPGTVSRRDLVADHAGKVKGGYSPGKASSRWGWAANARAGVPPWWREISQVRSVRMAILSATVLLAASGLASRAVAGSVMDLWDTSRGTIVTAHSEDLSSFPVENMFGASLGGYDYAIFGDRELAGFVHFVQWRTPKPIRLTGFYLYANHDGPPYDANERGFSRFTLLAQNPVTLNFEPLFSYYPSNPYTYIGSSFLLVSAAVTPTVAQNFRAEFVQFGDRTPSARGPRVAELDGYGSIVFPPICTCPAATVVECGSEAELTAQVSHPSGQAMAVVWTLNGTALQTNLVPAGPPGVVTNLSLSGGFPLGTNVLGITVTDGINVTSCATTVTVVDTTPPAVEEVVASPAVLWPPNLRMVKVTLRAAVSHVCGDATWSIVVVQCNEAAHALGDQRTLPDWSITGADTVFLRAERSGRGDSRVYYIQVQATDASGNRSEIRTVTVTVPKRLGEGE